MAFYFQKVRRHYFFMPVKAAVIFIFMLWAVSCSKTKMNSEEIPVAKAYGKTLSLSDIGDIAKGAETEDDSIMKVNVFIEQWLRQQVLLHRAEQILDEEKKDVERQ